MFITGFTSIWPVLWPFDLSSWMHWTPDKYFHNWLTKSIQTN